MNYRTAARELVMLAIPQLPKDKSKLDTIDFGKLLISFTRSLGDYSKKNIKSVYIDLQKMEDYLSNAEIEHPDNEEKVSQIQPVLIPDTNELKRVVELLKQSTLELYNAIETPELIAHSDQDLTKDFALKIFEAYIQNKDKVNNTIDEAANLRKNDKKWKVDRMVRLDRDILRIATTELLFLDIPKEVACDEAVKIAEKYGGDESKKFVNGVLGDIVYLVEDKLKSNELRIKNDPVTEIP